LTHLLHQCTGRWAVLDEGWTSRRNWRSVCPPSVCLSVCLCLV